MANGVLSAISDNVFVATVYMNELYEALQAGQVTREHFDLLTVAINTGTNIPSVATPNGQAAFLFLLTSALAPLIRLSYGRVCGGQSSSRNREAKTGDQRKINQVR
jgi:NhaB family Na+:H+ antiporter